MEEKHVVEVDLNRDSEALAHRCVSICEDRQAVDIMLFDVRESSILADFFLICSGNSEPHVRAIRGHLTKDLADSGVRPRVEGEPASRWIVLDYGSVLVHIMDPERRAFYRIEELWDAEKVIKRSNQDDVN